ncbi:hypothetical protein C0992_000048 [Termitomyces sp. T32_za158]|nr:hypothetical protein C0992_000048 [Termitomyces sp. T32_za158]
MSIPAHVYKIVPSDLIVFPLPERLPLSPLDEKDGFIHLSTAKQLLGTLSRFFANETSIYILRIKYETIEPCVRWENSSKGNGEPGTNPEGLQDSVDVHVFVEPGVIGDNNVFPHLYNGGRLGREEIENVVTIEKESKDWDIEKIKESDWLID